LTKEKVKKESSKSQKFVSFFFFERKVCEIVGKRIICIFNKKVTQNVSNSNMGLANWISQKPIWMKDYVFC
jgi:hypothetical protein